MIFDEVSRLKESNANLNVPMLRHMLSARFPRIPHRMTLSRWIAGETCPSTSMNTFRPEPSEELSFFLGAWLGDGWADEADGGKRLLLKVRSREFAEEFARCATRILNKAKTYKIREISEETRRWYLVRVTSMLLYDFVKQPVPKLKPFILPCSASFLRGFFTAEGCPCVSIENTNRPFLDAGLVVANSDYRLLEFARDLLSNLRFHPGRIRLNMLEGTRTNLAVARSSG